MTEVRIPTPITPLVDPRTGAVSRAWWRFFYDQWQRTGGGGDVSLQAFGDDLTAVEALTTIGLATRAAANTWTTRTITAAGGVFVADGDGAAGNPTLDVAFQAFEVAIGQADLASGGSKIILDAAASETWKVRHVLLSGAGTNFSGGGGDRDMALTDGTSTWGVVPAATLQALAAARWGDTGLPFPATAAHLTAASAAGVDIVASYSGGATDYTAGACTIVLIAERTA